MTVLRPRLTACEPIQSYVCYPTIHHTDTTENVTASGPHGVSGHQHLRDADLPAELRTKTKDGMSSLVFTHIETLTKRVGSTVYRAVTGAGVYDISEELGARIEASDLVEQRVVLQIGDDGGLGRIVGISTRDGSQWLGRINYKPAAPPN